MNDCMNFPITVEEFMEQYKVIDTDGIYMSKGCALVPIFRMKQWFEHLQKPCDDTISRQAAIDATWEEPTYTDPINVLTEVRDRIKQLPSAQPKSANEPTKTVHIVPNEDFISRKTAIDALGVWCYDQSDERTIDEVLLGLPSAQPNIIFCRECQYGEQDNDGWWYCRSFGCQVGKEDGSGFCANAERKSGD